MPFSYFVNTCHSRLCFFQENTNKQYIWQQQSVGRKQFSAQNYRCASSYHNIMRSSTREKFNILFLPYNEERCTIQILHSMLPYSLRRPSVGLHLLCWAFSTAIKDTGKNLDTVNLCVPSPKKEAIFFCFLLPFPPHVAVLNNNFRMSCFF